MAHSIIIHLKKNEDVIALNITKQVLEKMLRVRFINDIDENIPSLLKLENEWHLLAILITGGYRIVPLYVLGERRLFRSYYSNNTIKLSRIVSTCNITRYIDSLASKNIPFTLEAV